MKRSGRSATQEAQPEARANVPLDEPTDAALGAALHQGDDSALAALYDRHLPAIYDFLARYLRDPNSAEDLAQTTFVRAWERRETLRNPDGVRPWLFTIAHNLATNQLTRRRAEPVEERYDLVAPEPGPEQEAVTREAATMVWAAASSLEPRQYAILDLCIRRELSTREVAEVLEMPVGHAAVLVNRAKEALGNAVRYLLVAQRRDQCQRLAALVPAGVTALTPALRSAVDHHMRRCDSCRNLGRRLTTPAELFGGLVALPVPGSLQGARRDHVLTSARRRLEGGLGPVRWLRSRRVRWASALAVLAMFALATFIVVHRRSEASTGGTPATFGPAPAISSSPAQPSGSLAPSTAPPEPTNLPAQQPAGSPARPSPPPTSLPTSSPGAATPAASPAPATPWPSGVTGTVAQPQQSAQPAGRYRRTPPVLSP
jgi:RNA polymerase sigma factor (sigma-70 family)